MEVYANVCILQKILTKLQLQNYAVFRHGAPGIRNISDVLIQLAAFSVKKTHITKHNTKWAATVGRMQRVNKSH